MSTTLVRPSPYGSPTQRPDADQVKKKSFLKSSVSGHAFGSSLKGGAKGFAVGGVPGMIIGGILGGFKGASEDQKANQAAMAEQDWQDYQQLTEQRAMNRKRAVSDGLSKYYSSLNNPAFLQASKLGEPTIMPAFDPATVYGTDTEDWQVPVAPSSKAPAWWTGVAEGAADAYDAYNAQKPALPAPKAPAYRNNPLFNSGTFDFKTAPSYAPTGTRSISLSGGGTYQNPMTRGVTWNPQTASWQ